MSYSWVDPHFAALYVRREELRLTEKLLADACARAGRPPELAAVEWRHSSWHEHELPGSPNLRLI